MARKVDESDTKETFEPILTPKEKIEQDDEGEMSFEDWRKAVTPFLDAFVLKCAQGAEKKGIDIRGMQRRGKPVKK